jgi:hypothetical protein
MQILSCGNTVHPSDRVTTQNIHQQQPCSIVSGGYLEIALIPSWCKVLPCKEMWSEEQCRERIKRNSNCPQCTEVVKKYQRSVFFLLIVHLGRIVKLTQTCCCICPSMVIVRGTETWNRKEAPVDFHSNVRQQSMHGKKPLDSEFWQVYSVVHRPAVRSTGSAGYALDFSTGLLVTRREPVP